MNKRREMPAKEMETSTRRKGKINKKTRERKKRNICSAVMADWLAPNCSRVPTAAKLSSITVYPSCMPLRQDPLLGEVAIDSRPFFFFFFFFVFLCSNNLLMARFPYFFFPPLLVQVFALSLSLFHIVHDGLTAPPNWTRGLVFCVCC